jgi:hypothetical protein
MRGSSDLTEDSTARGHFCKYLSISRPGGAERSRGGRSSGEDGSPRIGRATVGPLPTGMRSGPRVASASLCGLTHVVADERSDDRATLRGASTDSPAADRGRRLARYVVGRRAGRQSRARARRSTGARPPSASSNCSTKPYARQRVVRRPPETAPPTVAPAACSGRALARPRRSARGPFRQSAVPTGRVDPTPGEQCLTGTPAAAGGHAPRSPRGRPNAVRRFSSVVSWRGVE